MTPACETIDPAFGPGRDDPLGPALDRFPTPLIRDLLEWFQESGGFSQVFATTGFGGRASLVTSLDGMTAIPAAWMRALEPFWRTVRGEPRLASVAVEAGTLHAVLIPQADDGGAALVAGLVGGVDDAMAPDRADILLKRAGSVAHALRAEQRMRWTGEALQILGDQLQEAVVIYLPERGIGYANAAAHRLLGLTWETLAALSDEDLFTRVHAHDRAAVVAMYQRVLRSPGTSHTVECRVRDGEDAWRWCSFRGVRLAGDPGIACLGFSIVDISDRAGTRQFLECQASHDSLTGLVNRAAFDRHTAELLDGERPGALLIVELNRFRLVNSIYGHATGDLLLQELGGRFQVEQQAGDIVSRYGGDEFLIFTPAADRSAAIQRAQAYLASLRDVFSVRGRAIAMQALVGIACAPDHGVSLDQLYRAADRALYRVKTARNERIAVFDQDVDGYLDHADRLAREFSGGIESGEIGLWFQPVCDLETGAVVSCEGLLRWRHPELGVLCPREVLPVMVDHGFEDILAKHTIRQALDAIDLLGIPVAVNLSPSQLRNPRLASWLRELLAGRSTDPHYLTIEVTESEAVATPHTGMKTLRTIRDVGVRVAIDDFGTGYSDLAAIQTYPADILKIDRSFVALLDGERDSGAIVRGIMAIAEDRGLAVIAEGIETERQRARLREMGCSQGQGYLFGQAMPLADLAATLASVSLPS